MYKQGLLATASWLTETQAAGMQSLRRVVPGRPPSVQPSGEGFLAILGDAASSIVCGGAAGTIM